MLQLLRWLRSYRGLIVVVVLVLLVAASAELGIGLAVRSVVDHGFSRTRDGILNGYFFALFGVICLYAVATGFRVWLVSWLGERVVADIRSDVFGHLVNLSQGFFETTKTAEVQSRLVADTSLLQLLIVGTAPGSLRSLVVFCGGAVLLAISSPKLAGIVFVMLPILVLPAAAFGRRVRRLSRAAQDELAHVNVVAHESLDAIKTVQAFTHETLDQLRFAEAVSLALRAAQRRILAESLLASVIILLILGLINGVLWIGARDVLAGKMTAGELTAFVFYAVLMASSLGALSGAWTQLQRASGAAERLLELLNVSPEISAPSEPVALPAPPRGAVRFERVTFCYPSREGIAALDDFSLDIAPGEKVALVGPSGAGKSTVFNLILRFYDPQAGRVLLDDVDVRSVDPRQLRERIGLVSQDPVMFSGDVADNIRYGRPDASDEEVQLAAEAAGAMEFIRKLPQGFQTHLGEHGMRLSGGQRQRLAIARTVLRHSCVLLFDEATSALDSATEQLVQQALHRVAEGRTAIIIAHRLATVQKADRIIVLDEGRAVASGTHADLMQTSALYAELARLQFEQPPSFNPKPTATT